MKIRIDGLCRRLRQHLAQRRKLRLLHRADRAEFFQQLFAPLRPHAWDLFERRFAQPLRAQLPVIFDRKAVRLLLDAPDEREHGLIARNADLMSVRGHERARPVPVVLNHAVDRDIQCKLAHDLLRDLCMLHTAVDQQGVWLFRKSGVTRRKMPQPPREHLPHRGVIVLIRHVLQFEALIVLF